MLIEILMHGVFVLGMLAALVCIFLSFKGYKQNRKLINQELESKHQVSKLLENHEKILEKLNIIELCVKDLNVRVTIAEVRLEERKPQTVVATAPPPAKRGRKPKLLK
jgi:hypothetical protein